MATNSMWGQPPRLTTDASGNTVLVGADLEISLNKSYDQYGRSTSRDQPYEIPGYSGTPVDLSAATFAVSSGASILTSDIPGIGSGLGVNITNGGNATADITLAAALPMDDLLMFTLEVYRAPSNATPVTLKIYFDAGAGTFSNYWNAYATITATGRQLISIPRGALFKTGTPVEADGALLIRYRIDNAVVAQCPALPVGESIQIGVLRKNPRTRAKVMFTHDDGKSALVNYAAKVATYGYPVNAYVVPAVVGKTGYVTLAQLQSMQESGHTIGNHSYTHPADAANNGIMLLGPVGIGIGITGINTTTGVITAATNRAPVGYAAPIVFGGTALPTGIISGARYYPKNVSADTFTIHPTLDDSIAGTNKIIPSTAGTSVTFSYADATADETGIKNDFQMAADWLSANGFSPWHCALPQASHDYYVNAALMQLPTLTVRGVFDEFKNSAKMDGTPTYYTYPESQLGTIKSTTLAGAWMNLPSATDCSLGLTAAVKLFLDGLVTTGATGCLLEHGSTDAKTIEVCDYVKKLEEAGLIDVVTNVSWKSGYAARF